MYTPWSKHLLNVSCGLGEGEAEEMEWDRYYLGNVFEE